MSLRKEGIQTVVSTLHLESYFIGSSCDGVDGTDNLIYIDALRFLGHIGKKSNPYYIDFFFPYILGHVISLFHCIN